ncbi:MAG: hypothetical protein K1W17_00040 [Oscillospiraceae bacterium]
MWLSIPKRSKMINLDLYSSVHIITVDAENGLYDLSAYGIKSNFAEILISPCSLDHAQNQLSNILHGLSRGAAVCRVYDEDEAPNDTRKEQSQ